MPNFRPTLTDPPQVWTRISEDKLEVGVTVNRTTLTNLKTSHLQQIVGSFAVEFLESVATAINASDAKPAN